MTARMDNSFINYVDFIDVAIEALETAPKKLFIKMMRMIINTFHIESIEIQRQTLEIEAMHVIPVENLDDFYDGILDSIDDVKLLKKKLENIKNKDELFLDLLEQVEEMHLSLVQYMDKMGQLEVRILTEKQSA